MSDDNSKKTENENKDAEKIDVAAFEVVDEVIDISADAADDMAFDVVDEIVEISADATSGLVDDLDDDDLDDFDDLDDVLVATGASAGRVKPKSSKAPVVVLGVLALLAAGGAGYYFLSGSMSSSPSVVPSPIVSAPVATNVVSDPVIEDVAAVVDPVLNPVVVSTEDSIDSEMFTDLPQPEALESVVIDTEAMVMDDVINVAGIVETVKDMPAPAVDDDIIDVVAEEFDLNEEVLPIDADSVTIDMPESTSDVVDADDIIDIQAEPTPVSEDVPDPVVAQLPVKKKVTPEDMYFDSIQEINQQQNTLQSSGPREVNPIIEPASKYLIVTETKPANSIEAEVMQAKRALKLGRYDAANQYYEKLYKRSPRDEAILMGRAVSLHKLGRESAAINAYEELLSHHAENADALVNMLGLVKSQYPAVALQKLLSVRQKYPENAGVVAQIGLTYAGMKNNKDAHRYLSMAMQIEPNNALHAYNQAVVYDREGNRDKAINMYDQALRTDAIYGGGRSVNRDVIYDRLSKLR